MDVERKNRYMRQMPLFEYERETMKEKVSKSNDEYKSVFGNRSNGNTGKAGILGWRSAMPEKILSLIDASTSRGGAVRFGFTRDGGAFACGLYYGGQSDTKYCRPSEDINTFIEECIGYFLDLPDTKGVSPAQ